MPSRWPESVGQPDTADLRAPLYNNTPISYNDSVAETEHVMTISRNGQVSIPAETRARWNTRRVLVVDLGDRVVMRPVGDEPLEELRGKYAGRGPGSDRARQEARRDDAAGARRR